MSDYIWIFNGNESKFPSGVFSSRENAEAWITDRKLSGIQSAYPLDIGVWDWAMEQQFFKVSKPHQKSADFISNFSSASLEHYHCSEGKIYS